MRDLVSTDLTGAAYLAPEAAYDEWPYPDLERPWRVYPPLPQAVLDAIEVDDEPVEEVF